MSEELLKDLNEIFQVKARLGIMTLLITLGECDFITLKSKLKLTDGNLGAHIRVLEEAGYLKIKKEFISRKPRTTCQVTDQGREAFINYLQQLEAIIKMVNSNQT